MGFGWNDFTVFSSWALLFWLAGALMAYKSKWYTWAVVFSLIGIALFGFFIGGMWLALERPPMRTMGETRLFYSAFVAVVGLGVYMKWRYAWILSFSTVLSAVFIVINICKPEIHDKTLMPALQSPWFVPHVIVYMFAYGMLGCAFLLALYVVWPAKRQKRGEVLSIADNLVYIGTGLLTLGMLFGALWAKEAWGHYWGWDPKETWAAVTWFTYLGYIHLRYRYPHDQKTAQVVLMVAFLFLQICWYGVNYLPSAAESVHTYFEMQ